MDDEEKIDPAEFKRLKAAHVKRQEAAKKHRVKRREAGEKRISLYVPAHIAGELLKEMKATKARLLRANPAP